MPFPFVERDALERELQYSATDFPGTTSESEWNGLLEHALKAASERVEGYVDDQDWRDEDATVPYVVRGVVIRLARQRIAGIREDGISSEDLVSGAGYDYRPPQAVRDEVKDTLEEAGYRTGDEEFWSVSL
ncbi:hypothetical protein C2R22_05940 [Salinigranum rubrum]|uniref:Uncharacterized protein n=1 Tax=Salinigranum rubrum TaxID=755307 RepID=A0A2I8VJM4_9EURY|nr:hypothetical protein [Salinigranum rubrum]AUV81259.1 hypothetical protein C2R22_05940 [Salinigranum rubrum]